MGLTHEQMLHNSKEQARSWGELHENAKRGGDIFGKAQKYKEASEAAGKLHEWLRAKQP